MNPNNILGYYFQDQLESGSWAGLGLNTNLSATFFLLAERNLRSQHVIAEAEQQQVRRGARRADKIAVSQQLHLDLPLAFAAQKLEESDMGGSGNDVLPLHPLKLSYDFLLPSLLFEVIQHKLLADFIYRQ